MWAHGLRAQEIVRGPRLVLDGVIRTHYKTVVRTQPFSLRVSEEELETFRKAAEEAKLSLSEWARLVLSAAAGSSALPEQLTRVVDFKPRKVRDGQW